MWNLLSFGNTRLECQIFFRVLRFCVLEIGRRNIFIAEDQMFAFLHFPFSPGFEISGNCTSLIGSRSFADIQPKWLEARVPVPVPDFKANRAGPGEGPGKRKKFTTECHDSPFFLAAFKNKANSAAPRRIQVPPTSAVVAQVNNSMSNITEKTGPGFRTDQFPVSFREHFDPRGSKKLAACFFCMKAYA